MFLQNVLQESTVITATYLAAPCAKVQQNVTAIRASASVGAKEDGLEKNAIKVVLHSLTLSKAACSYRGVYMYIYKRKLMYISFTGHPITR